MGFIRRHLRWFIAGCTVLVLLAAALATANNAFGRNVHGKVYCDSGVGVAGVFIEAEWLPRLWPFGLEVQSGFADTWWRGPESNSAEFDYWLPFSGPYGVHVGCGGPGPGLWASDNHSPLTGVADVTVHCNDPGNPPDFSKTLVTIDKCRIGT